jgi:hypothetical protein
MKSILLIFVEKQFKDVINNDIEVDEVKGKYNAVMSENSLSIDMK